VLKAIARTAHEQRAALYIVGGFVRDLLLERPSLDFDLVVEGDAIALTRALVRRYWGRMTSHARFGTAKWHIKGERPMLIARLAEAEKEQAESPLDPRSFDPTELPETLDMVSARTEFYPQPTALPTVERGSIKLDLHRRDFTINTLALRLDGHHYGDLHDYWGGLDDLQQGLVRVLHSLSFVDDPTRMLRAVRFEQRFDFQIEDRTLELLLEARSLLDRVSGDRIRHELDAILEEPRVASMLFRLDGLALLSAIHPAFQGDERLFRLIKSLPSLEPEGFWNLPDDLRGSALTRALSYVLMLIRLPQDRIKEVTKRLKLSKDLVEAALAARRIAQDLPELKDGVPSKIVTHLDEKPMLALYAIYLFKADDEPLRQLLRQYAKVWRRVSPTFTGHDLRERGLPPGPIYRHILDTLRAAWLDGEITNPEEELEMLDALVYEHAQR
jgi:tRNA nucleotidyltransferase (CCA-adding enzyme)